MTRMVASTPLRIVLVYLVVGVAWVLFSDYALGLLTVDRRLFLQMQTAKGWFFICATATMLYFLVRQGQGHVRRSEEAVRESEGFLRQVIDLVPHLIFAKDRHGRFILVNEAMAKAYGTTAGEMVGTEHRVVHPDADEVAVMLAEDREVLETGRSKFIRERDFTFADGRHRIMQAEKIPFRTPGSREPAVLGVDIDITEQKQLEGQLLQAQKMESVGQLAGGIAHDFNNQLGMILFDVDSLLSGLPGESPMRVELDSIREVVLRAADLTRQILVFSRRHPMAREPVDLNEQVADLQKMMRRVIGEEIVFGLDFAEGLWQVNADLANIDQVLMNLVLNARDAMPRGGKLTVETRNVKVDATYCRRYGQARPGEFVCLAVSDTGEGIPDEIVDRIFDPFFTTKEVGRGTGLGLPVVYGVVQAHEGWITVESSVGDGTRFEVFLPALAPDRGHETGAMSSADNALEPSLVGRVLLLEDEMGLRERIERVLTGREYSVVACGTLAEARESFRLASGEFDLFLSDMVLPDGRGVELVMELREEKPELSVLLITGHADESTDWQLVREANLPVLLKPFGIEDLVVRIEEVLEGGRTSME
jgi:two-component system, cell cycle sensor histidine kinase and response regulator CckA